MKTQHELLIRVHRDWNGCHSAEVPLPAIRDVQWFQPVHAPHPLIHGFVRCTSIVTGELPHTCDRETAPHDLFVCVLKKHAISTAYTELVRRAERISRREQTELTAAYGEDRQSRVGS